MGPAGAAGGKSLHVSTLRRRFCSLTVQQVVLHLAMEALKCYSESSEDEHSSVSETGITKTGVSCIHLDPTSPSDKFIERHSATVITVVCVVR